MANNPRGKKLSVEAVEYCDRSIKIKPSAAAYVSKAHAMILVDYYEPANSFNTEQYEETVANFDMGIKLGDNDCRTYINRGKVLNKIGKMDDIIDEPEKSKSAGATAVKSFEKAIELNPRCASEIKKELAMARAFAAGKYVDKDAEALGKTLKKILEKGK